MKKIIAISILACTLIAATLSAAPRKRILTVQSVVKKMERALHNLKDMKANYTLKNGKYTSNGLFYYKRPYFLRLNSLKDGSQIVSNGKKLWIYIPYYGIVAEQELIRSERRAKLLLVSYRKSLNHLKREYSFRFAPDGRSNKQFYILDLQPRVTKIGFKSIRLWVSKKTMLISKVNSVTINNRIVNISFSNVQKNLVKTLPNGLFWFGMPDQNVQVIKNTILPVNIFKKRG